jgi:hypothetical protein
LGGGGLFCVLLVNIELSRYAGVNLTGKFLRTCGKFTSQMRCSGKCIQHRPAFYELVQVRVAIAVTGVE